MALALSRYVVAFTAVCWLLLAGSAQAGTFTVTRTDDPAGQGTCPINCSLRQAVDLSVSGDTIALDAPSPYVYRLTQGDPLTVTHALTINGAQSTIDGTNNRDPQGRPDRILKVTDGPLLIYQLTFTGGTDGQDENFTSCSPCDTLNANGGGAIFNAGASLTLQSVAFDANTGSPVGGAIANTGTLNMTDVDFRANGAAFGAGLISSGTVTAERVTFRDAGGGTRGGAVFQRGGTMTLTNSTVSRNGSSSTVGGGITNRAGTLTLLNVTLTENLRGGLETAVGATTSVQNTILGRGYSDGTNGSCVGAGQTTSNGWTTAAPITNDLGHNLADDLTCGNLTAPSQAGIDAKLAPVGNNAGATPTAALLHGSPAIDAGDDSACPASDQRSVTRAGQGAHCDIGAFEAIKLGAPSVSASSALEIGAYGATLAATIDLANEAGALYFAWGTSPTELIQSTELVATGIVSPPGAQKTVPLYGLSPSTTYYFQAVADNATAGALGPVRQFTTPAATPVITDVNVTDVTSTAATINFSIDPLGDVTSYVISYDRPGGHGEIGPVDIGSAGPQPLTHTLLGLEPGTVYTFEVIATNSSGSQSSGTRQFTTAAEPDDPGDGGAGVQPIPTAQPSPSPTPTATPTPAPTPTPTFQQTVVVQPVSGTVLVKLKGSSKFVPLTAGQSIPLGSQIDVTKGKITLTSVPKAGGKPETATFYAGIFTVTQRGSITELRLSGPLAPCKAKGKASTAAKKPKTRKLWGDGKGQFRTRGQYSAATIRGTKWLVQDSCAGTLTRVSSGVVSVRDNVRGKTILVRAPRSYLARPR